LNTICQNGRKLSTPNQKAIKPSQKTISFLKFNLECIKAWSYIYPDDKEFMTAYETLLIENIEFSG